MPASTKAGNSAKTRREDSEAFTNCGFEQISRIYDDAVSIITYLKFSREDIVATGGILKYLRPRLFNETLSEILVILEVERTIPTPSLNTYAARAAKNMPVQLPRPR